MLVRELIQLLQRFEPSSQVRLTISPAGRVVQTYDQFLVARGKDGVELIAATDFAPFSILVGCGLGQIVRPIHPVFLEVDLGLYDDPMDIERVQDFYIHHQGLQIPLFQPDFDYENWLPPRTKSGEYNPHVAAILRRKLSEDA